MDKFREECNNYNEVIDLVDKLVQLIDTSKEKEALELRDKIYEIFTKKYSETIWNYLNLEEELGCSLEIVGKALKYGIFIKNIDGDMINFKCRLTYKNEELGWYFNIINGYVMVKDYKTTWFLKEDKSE